MNCQQLEKLGFKTAASRIKSDIHKMKKMNKAYLKYDFISEEDIDKFNTELKSKTIHQGPHGYPEYDKLCFLPIKDYPGAPPVEVLDKLEEAVKENCFDEFEIARIEAVEERPDPILFGRIKGCGDRFVIAQWDDDVTVEMIREISGSKDKV